MKKHTKYAIFKGTTFSFEKKFKGTSFDQMTYFTSHLQNRASLRTPVNRCRCRFIVLHRSQKGFLVFASMFSDIEAAKVLTETSLLINSFGKKY